MLYTKYYNMIKRAFGTPGIRTLKPGQNLWNIWKGLRKKGLTQDWNAYQKFFLRNNPGVKDINKLNTKTNYVLFSPTEH